MYISLLTALTFAGAREDLSRVEVDTLTALSTWSGVRQIDADVARIASRAHYSEDATKKALASLENKGLIARKARFNGGERLASIIYVDWRSALAEECRNDYDRIADAGDGARNFPSSRENNPHIWGDEPAADADSTTEVKAAKTAAHKPPKKPKAHVIPEAWRPSEKALTLTREQYPSMPIDIEVRKFIAYWRDKGTKRPGWDRSWERWCANGNGFANGAWTQQPAPGSPQATPKINLTTGKAVTKEDFWYACKDHGIDPAPYVNFWKPSMGLPGDPGWANAQAYLDRHTGRA